MTPATDKEVEEALIKEAKKRYKNSQAKCLHDASDYNSKEEYEINHESDGCLRFKNNTGVGCLFSMGKWATIINTITKEEAEKELGKTIIDQ